MHQPDKDFFFWIFFRFFLLLHNTWIRQKQGCKNGFWRENKIFGLASVAKFISYTKFPKQMRSKIVFLLSLHHIEHTPNIDLSCSKKKQGQDVDINSRACSDQCLAQLQRVSKGCYIICNRSGSGPLGEGHIFTVFATTPKFCPIKIHLKICALNKWPCTKLHKWDCECIYSSVSHLL